MSVHRLRRLLPQLDQLGPDGTWMREGIEIYLATAARGGTLDAALGLRGASGTTPWWRHEQLAQRDELLFELWQALLGELDPPAASREIERQARFYENGQWRRDQHRDRGQMLDSYAKTTLAFRFKMRHIGKIPQAKQLCNFDEWRAAEAKRKTLTEQRQQLSERRLRLERELHDYAANGVATRAAELLGEDGGAAWPPYQALVGEYQALDVELRAVRQAQRVYGERAASLRHVAVHGCETPRCGFMRRPGAARAGPL